MLPSLSVTVGRVGVRRWIGGALLLAASLGGCNAFDELLSVELPGAIAAEDAEAPAKAATLVNGGITLFNCALLGHIEQGAILGDELSTGSGGASWGDNRAFFLEYTAGSTAGTGCTGQSYGATAGARWHNEHTLALLEGWSDQDVANRLSLIAQAAVYAGYSLVLLAERFCSAAIDGGPEISSAQVFERAEGRFTRALEAAAAASDQGMVNLARSGRARARLGLGRLADAAADALLVPQGYVKHAEYPGTAAGVNENGIYPAVWLGNLHTVDPRYRDMRFNGVADSRVVVTNTGLVTRYAEPLWVPAKHSSRTTPIEIATSAEAQLIVAEHRAKSGDLTGAIAIINALHDAAGLPDFSSSDPQSVMEQIIYERRAELFFEGQHLGDFRRLELPLIPAPGTPYYNEPGRTWGAERCFPMPNSERVNNPNLAVRK